MLVAYTATYMCHLPSTGTSVTLAQQRGDVTGGQVAPTSHNTAILTRWAV
jgi:hypothetical protein